MPVFEGTGYGDLFIEYNVVFPAQLTSGLRKGKLTEHQHTY